MILRRRARFEGIELQFLKKRRESGWEDR